MKNNRSKPRVLITGAAGFVGARLVTRLIDEGYVVVGVEYARNERCDRLERDGMKLHVADVCDNDVMRKVFDGSAVDIVVHCASQQPRKGFGFDEYYRGNIRTLDSVCDAMRDANVKKLVLFSSATVYGDGAKGVLDEESPVAPSNYYSISKWVVERIALARAEIDGIGGVCFRMPSVFGPGQGGGIVDTYYEMLRADTDLDIFSEGKLIRNLLYVDDLIDACVHAIERIDRFDDMNLMLLGSSDSLPMGEIARMMANKMKSKSEVRCVRTPAPVNANWDLCVDRVRGKLDFTPMSIEEGIERYLAEMGRYETEN